YVRDGDKTFGRNELKAYANVYLKKYVVLFVEGAQTFGRMYQVFDGNNELMANAPVFKRNLDGMFVDAGLAIRFRTDTKYKFTTCRVKVPRGFLRGIFILC